MRGSGSTGERMATLAGGRVREMLRAILVTGQTLIPADRPLAVLRVAFSAFRAGMIAVREHRADLRVAALATWQRCPGRLVTCGAIAVGARGSADGLALLLVALRAPSPPAPRSPRPCRVRSVTLHTLVVAAPVRAGCLRLVAAGARRGAPLVVRLVALRALARVRRAPRPAPQRAHLGRVAGAAGASGACGRYVGLMTTAAVAVSWQPRSRGGVARPTVRGARQGGLVCAVALRAPATV